MQPTWTYRDFVNDAKSRVREETCEGLRARLESGAPLAVLDVREADEVARGLLPRAVHLPRGMLEKHAAEHLPSRAVPIYVYCATGNRSALAADVLQRMGYAQVFNVTGGIERWQHLGFPLECEGPASCGTGGKLSWDEVRREFAIVSRRVPVLGSAERALAYLDHAATTHAPSSVIACYAEFLGQEYANIHRGTHLLSRKATERFEDSYGVVADFIGAELKNGCVVFTQNTTHALDLCSHVMASRPGKVVTTELEHHSNELTHRSRSPVLRARATSNGELDMNHLEELLRRHEVKLVAVTAGSNVTGYLPDVHRVARLAHEHGALVLVDAAQALAHLPLDVKPFDHPEHLDFVAAAGHKAYAPFGVGFLYGPRALMSEVPPYLPGGGTAVRVSPSSAEYLPAPDRHHGGTPNIAGVVGLSAGLSFLKRIGMDRVRAHELELLRPAMAALEAVGGVTLYGPPEPERRLGVVSFNVEGASELLTAAVLSEEGGLAVRNGRFCSHIYMDRLLQSRHTGREVPTGAVRASFGLYNRSEDVERLVEFVQRVRDRKWVGRYQLKGDAMSAEFAGRCADRWMEPTQGMDADSGDPLESGYLFEELHPEADTRAYLLADPSTREALLIDPVREHVDDYVALLRQRQLTLRYTVETHTHADHVAGSVRLKELTGARFAMHHAAPAPCVDVRLREGDTLLVGAVRVRVLETPGHTPDSVCLLTDDRVFTGDTLLLGTCGRTDLQQGNAAHMFHSLKRLMELPDEVRVYPGHDYRGQRFSTVGQERKSNKRVLLPSVEAFQAEMAALELPLPRRIHEALPANQSCQEPARA